MSARNFALCPQCREHRLIEQNNHDTKLCLAYGSVSRSEYERVKLDRPQKIEDETMGEYYEWEFTSDSKFCFYFHFCCDVCGFNWTHNGEAQYPLNKTIES